MCPRECDCCYSALLPQGLLHCTYCLIKGPGGKSYYLCILFLFLFTVTSSILVFKVPMRSPYAFYPGVALR